MQKQISPVNAQALIAYVKAEPVFKAALDKAKSLYAKDRRNYTGIAYVSHPMTVASVLLEFPVTAETMAIAALEEVLARTRFTEVELREQFGDVVADAVVALTPPKTSTQADLVAYGARLAGTTPAVQSVKLASMLDHICAIPTGKLKNAAGTMANFKVILPSLTAGDAELMRRVANALRRATA